MNNLGLAKTIELISSVSEIEGREVADFGVLMKWEDEKGEQKIQIDSISPNAEDVKRLIARLNENDVDPITLQEIAEDFVAEINTQQCFLIGHC